MCALYASRLRVLRGHKKILWDNNIYAHFVNIYVHYMHLDLEFQGAQKLYYWTIKKLQNFHRFCGV